MSILDVPTDSPAPAASSAADARARSARAATARRDELASFLRNRRERITPLDVGLPVVGRRRTPGLRREEVAQLAGVGVTWYTWLEQGRDIHPSPEVLEAIARTLQLDRTERQHLLTLAGAPFDPASGPACYAASPTVRSLLDQLEPFPAVVQNSRYDLLAYNGAYGHLVVDLDELPPEDRNSLWLLATHPAYRAALPDWEAGL